MTNVIPTETNGIPSLLPCPFCGGEASKRLFYKGKYRVHCNVCNAHSGDVCDTEAEAIAAWNTRAAMEFDNWFYLPKPKEPIVEETEPTYSWDGTKVKVDVFYQVQKQAIVNWARELDENIIKRICEVWNARAERTCHNTWDAELTGRLRFQCSECGSVSLEISPMFCPCCGAKVIA